jgi:hypothetical protein
MARALASPSRPCRPRGVAALAATDQQRPAAAVEIGLAQRKRFVDAKPRAPQHHHQPAQSPTLESVACGAHHRDDLLHGRRVSWIAQPLVARRTAGMKAGHGRRRAAPTGGIEHT